MNSPSSPSPSSARAAFVRASGISKSFGDLPVLTDVTVTVHSGARAGLIGANGSGKTTLLRILAGVLAPDAGTVEVPGGARVGLLTQEFSFPLSWTLRQCTQEALLPLSRMAQRVERAGSALVEDPEDPRRQHDLAEALDEAETHEVWSLDITRDRMLAGLGLGDIDPAREVATLSGGQRARLLLVCVLLARPDVLLLDEPTNHLDDDAAAHLVGVLTAWRGPVLAASHDRAFLDDVATEILDLDPVATTVGSDPDPASTAEARGALHGLTRTRGRYSDHVLARLDQQQAWEERFAQEQAELKRLRARSHSDQSVGHAGRAARTEAHASKKFYSDRNARVVRRRVDDVQRRLDALEGTQVRKPPRELAFRGFDVAGDPDVAGAGVHLRGAGVRGRLAPVTLDLAAGDHLLVTGPNGSGKSTLAALLAGRLQADVGRVEVSGSVGLLAQDPPAPTVGATAEATYEERVGAAVAAGVPLRSFGLLAPRDIARPVADLSTGMRRRLDLACLLADPPAVLILDEPTNHLSLDLATALEALLPDYPGIVVVTSHDRWLQRTWRGETLKLEGYVSGSL